MEAKDFGTEGKSISVWESIYQKLCPSTHVQLKGKMNSKIVQVQAFISKVENIKNWIPGTEKYDLAVFQKQLKEVEKFVNKIDFKSEYNWAVA